VHGAQAPAVQGGDLDDLEWPCERDEPVALCASQNGPLARETPARELALAALSVEVAVDVLVRCRDRPVVQVSGDMVRGLLGGSRWASLSTNLVAFV
jgi:hypothetical protein